MKARNIAVIVCLTCLLAAACYQFSLDLGEPGHKDITLVSIGMSLIGLGLCIMLYFTVSLDEHVNRGSVVFLDIVFLLALTFFSLFTSYICECNSGNGLLLNVSNYALYILILMEVFGYWRYIGYVVKKRNRLMRKLELLLRLLFVGGMLLILLNIPYGYLFTIDNDTYTNSDGLWLCLVFPMLMAVVVGYSVHRYIESRRGRFAIYCVAVLPLTAGLFDIFVADVGLVFLAMFFSVLILYGNFYVGRSEELIKKDAELVQQRASILVSQIQPHFLYNSLTSIMNIPGTPQSTRDAIADFGRYMRGNLDTLTQKNAIPLLKELDHVETYVMLEKLGLGDRLNLALNIRDRNFFIPSMTIQALVEICIEKSIKRSAEGGTVTITSDITDGAHVITITDDGAGLGIDDIAINQHETSVGIYTVRERLRTMVNGVLDIESNPGIGTEITIAIPRSKTNGPRGGS